MKDLPEYQKIAETWNVKEATFKEVVTSNEDCGPLGAAILALTSDDFVAKTVSKKDTNNVRSLYDNSWIELTGSSCFRHLKRSCTIRYGDSSLYASMLMQSTT
jgi:hypothetical protein